ncbi:MAG: GH3 auxin-responsive promoter family protein [Clostridia bacterium]|nr:GH3 auxin-responsive promoter family protein [Clostridia bacterium]MBR0510795.1 GH3 auxin-responsive promoter family protein [Clostridia bacterium]MBR0537496.1 GH3 auxin-responsive promoter family protein [Clostridia bacterium]
MIRKMLSRAAMRLMVVKGNGSLKRLQKATKAPMEINEALLKKIIKTNRNTEFGRTHRFDEIRTIEDFRKNVPPSGYDDYAPFIERMKNNEENVLTASKVLGYSRTSGSSGVPKYIPATTASLKAYVRYTWTRALALGAQELKKQGKRFVPGRGVFLSPATNETLPNGLPCSNIAEIGAREYGRFYPFILTLPTRRLFDMHDGDYIYNIYRFALQDPDVTFFFSVFFSINVSQLAYLKANWELLVNDIEKGIISDSVDLKPALRKALEKRIRPMPARAAYLRKQFEQGFDETLFRRLWPNLTVMCGIGNASFRSAAQHIRTVAGDVPFDFSIYGASEGLVAACYELESTDMQLLTDSCFYEFVPFDEPEERYLTLDQVEEGKKYEILITTQAGLYRYRLKDVIKIKGFRGKCPLISFVFRKGQLFNIAGEKFSEEDARTTIEMFEKAHGITVDHWIFYQDESVQPNRYALAIEGELNVDTDAAIDEIEDYIAQCNKRYGSQRAKCFIDRLVILQQAPGTHDAWAKKCIDRGASAAQIKPVHSLDNEEKREFFLSRIIG